MHVKTDAQAALILAALTAQAHAGLAVPVALGATAHVQEVVLLVAVNVQPDAMGRKEET